MSCICVGSSLLQALAAVSSGFVLQLCCFLPAVSQAHAKILLQNCYHKVALNVLLQNCYNADHAVDIAAMRWQKCCNNYLKIRYLLSIYPGWIEWAAKWAEVLDGFCEDEVAGVLFELRSQQSVMCFGDYRCDLSEEIQGL